MTTYFISDLHLEPENHQTYTLFKNFMQGQATQASALYILGDFFESWIGDDDPSEFNQQIADLCRTLKETHQVPIYYMHGNRDFLIGKKFLEHAACILLPDPTIVALDDQAVLLMHGDTLCTLDKAYLRFRKIVRNPWVQRLYLALPLKFRQKIANHLRQQSKDSSQNKSTMIMDVEQQSVLSTVRENKATTLIHGHTHRPAIHELQLGNTIGKRIVLGAWDQTPIILAYQNCSFELVTLFAD